MLKTITNLKPFGNAGSWKLLAMVILLVTGLMYGDAVAGLFGRGCCRGRLFGNRMQSRRQTTITIDRSFQQEMVPQAVPQQPQMVTPNCCQPVPPQPEIVAPEPIPAAPSCSSCPQATPQAAPQPTDGAGVVYDVPVMVRRVNRYRARFGLRPLRYDRSLEIATTYQNQRQGTSRFLRHYRYPAYQGEFENIWFGWGAAASEPNAFQDWVNSPGHRRTMLRRDITRMGASCVRINGQLNCAQRFR